MEIKQIKTGLIKPDKNQPRKSFKPTRIDEMAQSILTEGVINPIEIDEDYKIITGEMRWRAAVKAGLETIPCKILKIGGDERFMRQVVENIHHNTMTSWDTAKSIEKLLLLSPGDTKIGSGGRNDQGISWLSKKLGKSRAYIEEYLDVLKASEKFQKSVKSGVKHTMIRAIKNTPEKYKDQVEKKIVSGELKTRDGAYSISSAIKENPEKAEEILKQDYSESKTSDEVKKKINKVVDFTETPITDAFKNGIEAPKQCGKMVLMIIKWLKNHPANSVGKIHLERMVTNLTVLKDAIDNWLQNK